MDKTAPGSAGAGRVGGNMDFEILYRIQEMHTAFLNPIMVGVSALGNNGLIWILGAVVLLFFEKTRRCGILMLVSMAVCFVLGNMCIKNLVQRPRPCQIDTAVSLLVPIPSEYSFPSGHTLHGFTAATIIFLHNKKAGIAALLLAAVIAFSRMYLFVHFPTDILGGLILGVLAAIIVYQVYGKAEKRRENRSI